MRKLADKENRRDFSLDNIRFFLMFTVVFAHLLEVCAPFRNSWLLYKVIYAFHMPAFVFLFGCHAKYDPKRIVYRWCIPYAVFQTLYILFARVVLNADVRFQYTTPYWLLWYMLVCIFYQLLIPLFDTENKGRQALALVAAAALALLAGYEKTVGYYMSLSRFFVFQPWFLLGYYSKKNNMLEKLSLRGTTRGILSVVSLGGIALSVMLFKRVDIPDGLLYGACCYADCGGALWMRGAMFLVALSWIFLLFVGIRSFLDKKVVFLTAIGQNTWPVFLLHGFLIRAIPVYCPALLQSPGRVVLAACVILLLMGNKPVNRAVYWLSLSGLEKAWGRNF